MGILFSLCIGIYAVNVPLPPSLFQEIEERTCGTRLAMRIGTRTEQLFPTSLEWGNSQLSSQRNIWCSLELNKSVFSVVWIGYKLKLHSFEHHELKNANI